jgi:cathepsin L
MRLIESILIIGIALIPLICSTTPSLGDGFLPKLINLQSDVDTLWTSFKKGYKMTYNTTAEETHRFKIFTNNVKFIIQHNLEHDLGLHTYRLGINKYTALTNGEFRKKYNGFRRNKNSRSLHSNLRSIHVPAASYMTLPVSVDWRTQGLVTPIKDQGQCGSCWTFSSTGALEGQHARSTGKLVSLSEQQLLDCSTNWGNDGCDGGLMDNAFQYVHDSKGLDNEKTYPYTGKQGKSCKFRRNSVATTCNGFVDIPEGNETALQEAIALQGPISVAIDASQESFQFYVSGIYSDPQCSANNIDHAVLAVGYGVVNDPIKGNQEYYIIKNSWSTAWGDQGYINIARNQNNMCGISSSASYPIVKDKSVPREVINY